MAWDSTRSVPWQRLIRDWLLYAGIMTIVFLVLYRDEATGLLAGLFVSGPIFVVVGAVLAKFGYQRKTIKSLRAQSAAARQANVDAVPAGRVPGRAKPAPTKRTSSGPSRPSASTRRRKR